VKLFRGRKEREEDKEQHQDLATVLDQRQRRAEARLTAVMQEAQVIRRQIRKEPG
jgi:hypothetical protein